MHGKHVVGKGRVNWSSRVLFGAEENEREIKEGGLV